MNLLLKFDLKDSKLVMYLIWCKFNNFYIMLCVVYYLLIFKNFFIYSFVYVYVKDRLV